MALATDKQEGRVWQALDELNAGQHSSIGTAARAHNVAKSTLYDRLNGAQSKKDAHTHQQLLLPAAETALVKRIQRCAASGFPLNPGDVCSYAQTLAHHTSGESDAAKLGRAWMQGFLLWHQQIQSAWLHCLENAQV